MKSIIHTEILLIWSLVFNIPLHLPSILNSYNNCFWKALMKRERERETELKDKLSSQRLFCFSALVKDTVGQTSIRISAEVFERAASVQTSDRNKRWRCKREERRRSGERGQVFLFNSVKATGRSTESDDAVNRWRSLSCRPTVTDHHEL